MTVEMLYPPVMDPKTLTRQVWDTDTARRIPGVGRALDLTGGLIAQMPLDVFRGINPMTRPGFLERPDLDKGRALFVRLHVDDYQLHGNAAHLVTVRGADGYPAATRWYPATAWHVYRDEKTGRRRYFLYGREVNADDVVHVQNGADPMNDCRGVGVVERYVRSLDTIAMQDERQRQDTAGGNVPSVAVIAPPSVAGEVGSDETDDELDEQAKRWEAKFAGPGRRPAMLPHGTTVTPLAWTPSDAEAQAARTAALTDTANMFNLDANWLGAPNGSHNYKSPGPLFLVLIRTTLNVILAPFEDEWSEKWLPRGKRVVFGRDAVQMDDFASTITALVQATGRPVLTVDEGRERLSLGPVPGGDVLGTIPAPAPPAPVPVPDQTPEA